MGCGNASTCTRTNYFRLSLESIPDGLLFEILVRLPAHDIYFGARLVCRKWYHMTRTKYFIHKHLEHASYGLLYENRSGDVVFVSPREDGGAIETHKLNYNFKTRVPAVMSSWNGLVLEYEFPVTGLIYRVTNVLTGQSFCLPPCPYYHYYHAFGGIGYDATSNTYKVVVPFIEKSGEYGCAILTLGVDPSWRIVHTDHLSLHGKHTIMTCVITTEGFVHWKTVVHTKVVTLSLMTEIIMETTLPKVENNKTRTWYLSTGRYLSLFLQPKLLVLEVFEMKPETGEWRKFADICLEGQHGRIERLGFEHTRITPFGWLKYPEVLALMVNCSVIIFYNFITCEIDDKTLSTEDPKVTLHKNSLEWLCEP